MGNNWIKRHRHETDDRIRRDKIRYDKWKVEFRKRFPRDEDFHDHIRKKYNWPRFSKYQRNEISQGKLNDEEE